MKKIAKFIEIHICFCLNENYSIAFRPFSSRFSSIRRRCKTDVKGRIHTHPFPARFFSEYLRRLIRDLLSYLSPFICCLFLNLHCRSTLVRVSNVNCIRRVVHPSGSPKHVTLLSSIPLPVLRKSHQISITARLILQQRACDRVFIQIL